MHSINLSGNKMGIKFAKDPLTVEQSNYASKIISIYIAYDLDAWPRNPADNFKCNNCLFAATNIVINIDKKKYVYSIYGITFDSSGSWSFGNDIARNVIIFGVDNSSSPHHNHKKLFNIR